MLSTTLAVAVAGLACCAVYAYAQRRRLPLPPGPPRWPLVGNLKFPTKDEYLVYADWHRAYGDIVYTAAMGIPIVVLNSLEAVSELLDRQGAISSSRPRSAMFDMAGTSDTLMPGMPYGDAWRARRRVFHGVNLPARVGQYRALEAEQTHLFLRELLREPSSFLGATQWFLGAILLRMTYGIKPKRTGDPILHTAEELIEVQKHLLIPGKFLVEFMPFLRYVPAWMPGAGFKKLSAATRAVAEKVRFGPYDAVSAAMERGDIQDTMLARMLNEFSHVPDHKIVAIDAAASSYVAGFDTTYGTTLSFILAMAQNPAVQARAQAELDAVVGPTRLPEHADRDALPYVTAVMLEVMRWRPVVPTALPHATVADTTLRGFHIPAGSVVIANSWAILHDPQVYPEPDAFRPERFLEAGPDGTLQMNKKVLDPRTVIFGYGRRICPGRHVAEDTVWIACASLLATMQIGADGVAPPSVKFASGIIAIPEAFECDIRPRSAQAEALVREAADVVDMGDDEKGGAVRGE